MKSFKIELKWAIIFVLMSLLWLAGEKWSGLHSEHIARHVIYTNLFAIPAIALYVMALLDKRKHFYGGSMNYVQGFKSGVVITLVVTLLSPLSQYIIHEFISPEYFVNMREYVVESGKMTAEQAAANFNLKSYILQAVVGALAMGLVTTAVVALFVRKRAAA